MVFDCGSHVLERERRDETDTPPARDRSTEPDAVILALHQIGKTFPGVVALAEVSFDLRRGEVHAVCGENGAGKSTLMKIISGVYTPTTGRILYTGVERHFSRRCRPRRPGSR